MIHAGPVGIRKSKTTFYICRKNRIIGSIYPWSGGETGQIGYGLKDKEFFNKGFMTKSLMTVLPYISRSHRQLMISPNNKSSIRVAEKCGFNYYTTRESGCLWFRHPSYLLP